VLRLRSSAGSMPISRRRCRSAARSCREASGLPGPRYGEVQWVLVNMPDTATCSAGVAASTMLSRASSSLMCGSFRCSPPSCVHSPPARALTGEAQSQDRQVPDGAPWWEPCAHRIIFNSSSYWQPSSPSASAAIEPQTTGASCHPARRTVPEAWVLVRPQTFLQSRG
jgi:hypothetical protein